MRPFETAILLHQKLDQHYTTIDGRQTEILPLWGQGYIISKSSEDWERIYKMLDRGAAVCACCDGRGIHVHQMLVDEWLVVESSRCNKCQGTGIAYFMSHN